MNLDQLSAALADRYRVIRELGEGGMAVVFLATDLKHDRPVAIKVLRPQLAASIGAERFLKEIRLTARLSHPNILQLHDSGEAGGLLYYVMPFVEGETLRSYLSRTRQLDVAEAITLTRSIASALHYAHEQDIIHRDVKPENVLLHAGQPLVADFGIALTLTPDATRLTAAGSSIGSPAYMSPEQAAGDREVDRRSDVYSLACVLYEMLAGDPPFTGSNIQALIARIVGEAPTPIRRLRATVPRPVAAALERALQKAPSDRFSTAMDFANALEGGARFALPGTRRQRLIGAAAAAILGVGLIVSASGQRRSSTLAPARHTQLSFTGNAGHPVVSPDGQSAAFIDRPVPSSEGARLFLVDVTGGEPREIARDTHLLIRPRWRPDGSALLVYAGMSGDRHQHGLYLIPRLGGERRLVLPGLEFPDLSWSADGQRIAVVDTGILKILDLRLPQPVTDSAPVRFGGAHGYRPAWNPTSDWIAIQTPHPPHPTGMVIRLIDLRGRMQDSIRQASGPVWHPSGQALYYRHEGGSGSETRKIRFDARTGRFRGEPVAVLVDPRQMFVEDAWADGRRALYTASTATSRIVRVPLLKAGAAGVAAEEELTSGTSYYSSPSVSPDGQWMAFRKNVGEGHDLFVRSIAGGSERRLTTTGRVIREAAWSHDGRRLAFGMETDSGNIPMTMLAAGGSTTRIGKGHSAHGGAPGQFAWSPDDKRLLYQHGDFRNVALVDLATNEERSLFDPSDEPQEIGAAVFSPDGRRVAVPGRTRGSEGVWILSLDGAGKRLLSSDRFTPLAWVGDSLFYRTDGAIRAMSVTTGMSRLRNRRPEDCYDVAFAPSRDWILCTRTQNFQDVWLIDGFDRP